MGVPNTSISTVYWLRLVLNPHETGLVKYPLDLNNISHNICPPCIHYFKLFLLYLYILYYIILYIYYIILYIYYIYPTIYIYILLKYQILRPIPHFFGHTEHGASFVAVHPSLARLQLRSLRVFARAAVEQTAHRQLLSISTSH